MTRVRSRRARGSRDPLADLSLEAELAARLAPQRHPGTIRLLAEAAAERPGLADLHVRIAAHFADLGDRDRALSHLDNARRMRATTPIGGYPRPTVTRERINLDGIA